MKDQAGKEALKAYQKLHPDFRFPTDYPENEILPAILNSLGRLMIVSRTEKGFKIYYEAGEEELPDIPEWNKLIGCGG